MQSQWPSKFATSKTHEGLSFSTLAGRLLIQWGGEIRPKPTENETVLWQSNPYTIVSS